MKQTFEVNNVKCGGCANTLITSLKADFGEIDVDLGVTPRKITLDLDEGRVDELKTKLKKMGYPFTNDDLAGFEKVAATAKSFVSCAIGKVNVARGD
jgi:copper chaperone